MMFRYLACLTVVLVSGVFFWTPSSYAVGIKVQPTLYEETLKKSETKKAYIDISNPQSTAINVRFSVQAFTQVDDQGGLQFIDSEQVREGITLDLDRAELAPKDVLRLYFLVDGTKLPEGDVFAAIFAEAQTDGKSEGASTQIGARVGTLLVLQNGTPTSRDAEVISIKTPWLQAGEGIELSTKVKNTAPAGEATGFFPNITVKYGLFGEKSYKGPLVFAGMTRTVEVRQPGNYVGPLLLTVRSGKSEQSKLVFAVTGYWRWVVPLIALAILVLIIVLNRLFRQAR